jgi:hypothetical protein
MRRLAVLAVLLAVSSPLAAGSSNVSFVPWKVLNPGDEPVKGALVLVWIPASREEIRRSQLVTSRALTIYATHCVGMQVIRPDDEPRIARYAAAGKLPVALLLDADGEELGRVEPVDGLLNVDDVAALVGDELATREAQAETLLDHAREKAADGDREFAIDLYRKVREARCLCPRQGKYAERALKRLGVRD